MDNYEREFRTVIVYGAGPCGKTYHGASIARALDCKEVVDEWGWQCPREIKPGALHLTHERPAPGSIPAGVLILPIESALAAAFVVGAI